MRTRIDLDLADELLRDHEGLGDFPMHDAVLDAHAAGARSCAAGPWIEGPPPEVEGIEVLIHQFTRRVGVTRRLPLEGWCVLLGRGREQYREILCHAVINPPPSSGKE
jgi:hypothetical protein